MTRQLDGKNVIITGANCGIGYETALELAKRNARVIIACRSKERGKNSLEKLKNESKSDQIELEILDLASLKSIKAFSERILAKLTRIDILINNAGEYNCAFQKQIINKTYRNKTKSIIRLERSGECALLEDRGRF